MKIIPTDIAGVLLLEPTVHEDARGFFFESFRQDLLAEHFDDVFVQDNHSRSARGTIRGLHYQMPHGQAKLCRVVAGKVLDVALDIRRGSPTFGRWFSAVLSAENRRQVLIPEGCAHGFAVLSEFAEFLYKCTDYYHPEHERGIAWDDPALAIPWGVTAPTLSGRDRGWPRLADIPPEFLPTYVPAAHPAYR